MSTAPTGWQAPKKNWQASDVVVASDFNRIEGNIDAIEQGSRTIDPAQAPSGNAGTLRQLLGWFANRIKAITGKANWYDAPDTTLAAASAHMNAATGVHGVGTYHVAKTSRADQFPSWVDIPDKPSNIALTPVPVTALKLAQGSVANVTEFNVHQYAFASPLLVNNDPDGNSIFAQLVISARAYTQRANVRMWFGQDGTAYGNGLSDPISVTWDYLTASGRPSLWAAVDDTGHIISMWEAEDPADPDFPDEPPIGAPEGAVAVVPLQIPDVTILQRAAERVQAAAGGQWLTKSKHRGKAPHTVLHDLVCEQCRARGLETPPDLRDVYTSIDDHDRRYWYVQLYLRQASRLIHDHRASTLIPLYEDMLRVDKRTGALELG